MAKQQYAVASATMTQLSSTGATQRTRTLSIIIPVRNMAATVRILLDRLKTLRVPKGWDVEIIVAYTDSTDDTVAVLQAYDVQIVQSKQIGPGAARNEAVRKCRGDLLYFVDADACPVGDDFLERLVQTAVRLGRFGAFGGPILLDSAQRCNPVALADHFACWFNWSARRPTQRTALFQPSVNLAVARKVFDALGGFDQNLRVLEDFELQQRLLQNKLPIFFVHELAVTHVARGSLLRSWRHSWYWGGPFRSVLLSDLARGKLRHPVGSRLFFANAPRLFFGRMHLVLRSAWRVSRWQTCMSFVFLAATVWIGTLATICGPDQPRPDRPAPV